MFVILRVVYCLECVCVFCVLYSIVLCIVVPLPRVHTHLQLIIIINNNNNKIKKLVVTKQQLYR
jgi:hypothetical protein